MWDYFVSSNAFNFLVLVVLFIGIVKKFKIGDALSGAVNGVADTIAKSEKEKSAANKELKSAQKLLAGVEAKIKDALKEAKSQAKILADKILQEAATRVKQIKAGVKRAVETEEKRISSQLTTLAAHKSVELARADIIAQLKKNPKLHEKFIEESIEQI